MPLWAGPCHRQMSALLQLGLAQRWPFGPDAGRQLKAPVHVRFSAWSLFQTQMIHLPRQAPPYGGALTLPCGGRFNDGAAAVGTQMEKLGSCAGRVRGQRVHPAGWSPLPFWRC